MRTVSKGRIRTADGSNSMKPDGCGRRTHPLRPPQGRIRTADAQTFFPGGRKRTADAPHSSASRTDSDGGQANFLESGRRRTPDEGGRSPSREPCCRFYGVEHQSKQIKANLNLFKFLLNYKVIIKFLLEPLRHIFFTLEKNQQNFQKLF